MPLFNLDTAQHRAASTDSRRVAVSAGAGSGKTTLLAARVLHLLRRDNLELSDIVAITFTTKAARQLKMRIGQRARDLAVRYPREAERWLCVAAQVHQAHISTIHSFCSGMLRDWPVEAGLDPAFNVLDEVAGTGLRRILVDDFIEERLTAVPEDMTFLLDVLGETGIESVLGTFLNRRPQVERCLEHWEHTGGCTPEGVEALVREELTARLERFRATIEDFHALVPGAEDGLGKLRSRVIAALGFLIDGIAQGNVDPAAVHDLQGAIVLRVGGKQWDEISREGLKQALREFREFLSVLASWSLNEKDGTTGRVTALLLREYRLLERRYAELKRASSYLDNDDLLIETWRLLRSQPAIRRVAARRHRHILVDEFQDTDGLQMDILTLLTGDSGATLFTVGDPKQSIYRFRGADVTVFSSLINASPEGYYPLSTNYRSSPPVSGFINRVFARVMGEEPANVYEAPFRVMESNRKDSPAIPAAELMVFDGTGVRTRAAEAAYVARRARILAEGADGLPPEPYGSMALLVRRSTTVTVFEEALMREGVPFVNRIGGRLAGSPEAYDLGNLLGWLAEPDDPALLTAVLLSPFCNVSARDVVMLKRRVSGHDDLKGALMQGDWSRMPTLAAAAELLGDLLRLADRSSLRSIIDEAIDRTGYTAILLADPIRGERSLAIVDLICAAADRFEREEGFHSIASFAALLRSGESFTGEAAQAGGTGDGALSIMTIHGAKGLEFDTVFLAGLASPGKAGDEGFLFDSRLGPGFRLLDTRGKRIETALRSLIKEEERLRDTAEGKRLFYVGCTRAKNRIVLTGGAPSRSDSGEYHGGNWMNWLHTALDIPRDGVDSFDDQLFRYRRVAADEMGTGEATVINLPVDSPAPVPVEAAPRRGMFDVPRSLLPASPPRTLSPTQIIEYDACPRRYWHRFVAGMESPGGLSGGGLGTTYGTAAHAVVEHVNLADTSSWEETVRGHAAGLPADLLETLGNDIAWFADSNLYHAIAAAEDVRREEPFAALRNDVLVRGTLDLRFRTSGGWTIVDVKTEHVAPDGVAAASAKHRLQLGLYAWALMQATLTLPHGAVICYLRSRIIDSLVVDEALIGDAVAATDRALTGIVEGDFGPRAGVLCGSCPWMGFCGSMG